MASAFKNPNGEKKAGTKKVPYAAIGGLVIIGGVAAVVIWKWDDIMAYIKGTPSIGSKEAIEAREVAAAIKTSGQVPFQTSIQSNMTWEQLQAQEQQFRAMSQQY